MKVIRNSNQWKEKRTPLLVALGNFDGVHLGHQVILKKLIKTAKERGWTSCVYTFDPHPAKILAPKTAPLLLQTLEQKLAALEQMGIDVTILETFSRDFSHLTPKQFFEDILVKRLKAKGLWAGYDFTFGFKRSGTVEVLKTLCKEKKIQLHIAKPQFKKETLVSSTQIRGLISDGKTKLARELLGKPFALIGKVVKGKGIGGQLGIHTANLQVENELLPKTGIYITRTSIQTSHIAPTFAKATAGRHRTSHKKWPSATSVGFNPTFPGKGFSVETHLIGFEGNLRGKKIEVEFLEWLRDELTFPNTETLATQIRKDIHEALRYHR